MFLLVLFLFGFVVAESSETSVYFNVGTAPSLSFWDAYGSYVIGLIIILIVVIVFLKRRPKNRIKKRKVKRKVKRKK